MVACGMYRYVFYRCVSVAWVVASFCLHSLSIFSSRLFSSFLVYSLIPYSNIVEYGRLPVECVGMFFYRCVSVAWVVASFCLQSLSIFSSRLFSSFLVYSLISYSSIFEYGRLLVACVGMFFIGVCRLLGWLPRFPYNHYM